MHWFKCACSLAIGAGVLLGQSPLPLNGISKNVLTNPGVALLAQAGYSEGFIIDIIHHKQTQFDVSAEGLSWLAKQGLSERIVRVMVANERKDELTAILPTTTITVRAGSEPNSSGQMVATAEKRETPVAVRVTMPTDPAYQSSSFVKGWERDRWYVVPNVPAISVSAR